MPRLMTYNVHRCVGVDRRLDVDRVAAVIAEHEPDIVCLQELDVGRARSEREFAHDRHQRGFRRLGMEEVVARVQRRQLDRDPRTRAHTVCGFVCQPGDRRGVAPAIALGIGEGHITLTDEAGLVVAVAVLMRRNA